MNQTSGTNKTQIINGTRFLVAGACFVIIITGLKAAKTILIPLMFAFFLALLASGPIYWLKSRKFPNFLAVSIVTVFIVALFVGVGYFLAVSVNQFSANLPNYHGNLNAFSNQVTDYLENKGINVSNIEQSFNIENYLGFFTKTVKSTLQTVSGTFLVLVMMIFLILETASLKKKIQQSFGDEADLSRFQDITIDVQRYLVIKTLTSAFTGLMVGTWASILGIDFPVLWGLVAFILNYVPFLGSIIAAVPAIILALVQFDASMAVTAAVGYLIINVGVSNFLEPVLMGRRLGLSVFIVFLSLVFWGWVWGPAGALMSVPLTMIVKIFFEHSSELNWVSIMLGSSYRQD